MRVRVHPDDQRVLDLIKASGRPPLHTLSPAEARAASAASRTVLQPDPPEVAEMRDLEGAGVRLRLYRGAGTVAGAVLPCLIYYHGGGWVIGDLESHDVVCRAIANLARCCVIAVDYRLAPEHRFPAAVDDSAAATAWIIGNAAALAIDPARIAVGGDSAGGNLAAVMALMSRDGALPPVGFQALVYPVTDLGAVHPSYDRVTDGFVLTDTTMKWFRAHYLRDAKDEQDWRASPLRAASLAGTAPAFVVTCTHDPLCDEGRAYAERLENEGVQVTLMHLSDHMHAFLTMGRFIRASGTVLAALAAALGEHWAPAAPG
jgi:acetyl esterase